MEEFQGNPYDIDSEKGGCNREDHMTLTINTAYCDCSNIVVNCILL